MTEQRTRRIPPPELGPMLNRARLRAGLRGAEAARLAGLSRQYLVRLECGTRCPSVDTAERLALVLELTAEEHAILMAAAVHPHASQTGATCS